MKKIISMILSLSMIVSIFFTSLNGNYKNAKASSVIDKAVDWAVGIANDSSHGYDQEHRWGPDYDCSSLVMSAYKEAGVSLDTTYSTTKQSSSYWMVPEYKRKGFTYIEWSRIGSVNNLHKGDILWRIGHTEMYIGNGQNVGAHINENSTTKGGKTGDQTGNEISVTKFSSSGSWTAVLRYNGELPPPPPPTGEYFPACGSGYTSIVNALNSIKVDSSYSYREKIANRNGISNYAGTAEQNTYMLGLLEQGLLKNPDYTTPTTTAATQKTTVATTTQPISNGYWDYTYFPKCNPGFASIVDALKSIGAESSYDYRKTIAALNGIINYSGTSDQNNQMRALLEQGKLIKSKVWVTVTTTKPTTTKPTTTTTTTTTTTKPTTTTTTRTSPKANGGFSALEIEFSPVQPKISASKKLITVEESKNVQQIDISVSGANGKYCSTEIHIYYDKRLEISLNRFEQPDVWLGDACKYLATIPGSMDSFAADYDMEGIKVLTYGENDYGKDGVYCSFNVILPEDAKPGDVFPIDIVYWTNGLNESLFVNKAVDRDGKLMQAYAWTQGIYNEEYNNNFKAESEDISKCSALADISRSVDGYIAIADVQETTTTKTTTTTTTITTSTTTTTKPVVNKELSLLIPDTSVKAGETFVVPVELQENPGISLLGFEISYDSNYIEFVDGVNGTVMGDSYFECVEGQNIIYIQWVNFDKNIVENGNILELAFKAKENVDSINTEIKIISDDGDATTFDNEIVKMNVKNGTVEISSEVSVPGDVNEDNVVDLKDVILIRRYIAGGWENKLNIDNADVNDDSAVDLKDVIYIRRYIAGGWDIELK